MAADAAVRIHNDFPSRHAAIALRAAHDKPAGGIDVIRNVIGIKQIARQHGQHDFFNHLFPQFFQADFRVMLR